MKKAWRMLFVLVLCLLPWAADAEAFELDTQAVMSGMDKSWLQGYEPAAEGGSLTICLPVRSENSDGKLTATLIMDEADISPIRTQKLSAVFWRSEGMFWVKLNFQLSAGRVNGDYTGRVLLEGKDKEGNNISSEYPVIIRIRDGKTGEGMTPRFKDVSSSLSAGELGGLNVTILNPGRRTTMEDVCLIVSDAAGDVLPGGSDTLRLDNVGPGEEVRAAYPLTVREGTKTGEKPLKVTVKYTALGKEMEWSETFTVPVAGNMGAAQPVISGVSAELVVGEKGTIRARVSNEGNEDMENVRLNVTDAAGDVLPDGSDTLRIGNIAPGGAADIEYPAVVKPDAKVALHTLTFTLSYSGKEEEEAWKENFTLPVTQEMRLENGGVQMAESVVQGDMATLTLPLMNMGKGELYNVMATLDMPGSAGRRSVLVGGLASGESKDAKISFTPGADTLGEAEGILTVTAEDAWGNATAFDLPVSIVVEEPAPVNAAGEIQKEEEEPPHLLYGLAAACALLLMGIILQGSLLRRKIHRMEEERL